MYVVIVLLPLMGSIIGLVLGRILGREVVGVMLTSLIGVSSVLSMYSLYEVGVCGNKVKVEILDWINSGILVGKWSMLIDSLTAVMLVVVTMVSCFGHVYSLEYMESEPDRIRFMSYISLFSFFMLMLVTGDNYLQLFLGWEGVGLCSFVLISYYYTRMESNKASIQAMLVNRVGDIGLALGIFMIYKEIGSIDYETVFSLGNRLSSEKVSVIGVLLLIGAMGKSGQIGLHIWLPNAMAAPTPVSALLHAATMVTAGVYLLGRSSPLLEYGGEVLSIITIVGGSTSIVAGTIGLLQNDLKKIIAYSTASQLGYMIAACGLSGYSIGIFHLGNHAFFKALLFLSAGAIIHGMGDEQDLRRLGGLYRIMPYTLSMVLIGSLALMGFPYLAGYYSKDVILEIGIASGIRAGLEGEGTISGMYSYICMLLGAFFTAFYSMRLMHLTFISKASSSKKVLEKAHEPGYRMTIPLLILSIGSIFVGYITKDMIIGVGTDFWNNAIYVHPTREVLIEAEFLDSNIKLVPLVVSILGLGSAWVLYTWEGRGTDKSVTTILYRLKLKNIGIYTFLNRKWLFDKIYTDWLYQGVLSMGYRGTYEIVDKGVLEMLGPRGTWNRIYEWSYVQSKLQSGHVYHYMFVMLLGVVIIGIIV